jgi:hypothetical protein
MRLGGRLAIVGLVLATVSGCSTPAVPAPQLRTFSYLKPGLLAVACDAGEPIPAVAGTLAGSSADPETIWLQGPGGARISVTWPAGFTVRFEPGAVVYNEAGKAVIRAGERLQLQARVGDHAGTPADPYPVSGLVLGGCYPPS